MKAGSKGAREQGRERGSREVPDAVRICEGCGDLAAGGACEHCAAIEADAVAYARTLWRDPNVMDVRAVRFTPREARDPKMRLWRTAFQGEMARLRLERQKVAARTRRRSIWREIEAWACAVFVFCGLLYFWAKIAEAVLEWQGW